MRAIRVVIMRKIEGYPTVFYVPTEDQSLVENMMVALNIGTLDVFQYYLTMVELTEKVIWPSDNKPFEELA